MIDEVLQLGRQLVRHANRPYQRYFMRENTLGHRFSIIVGPRGVGKTTALVQHLTTTHPDWETGGAALYVQADHFRLGDTTLYDIAEDFTNLGGKLLCIDEVHKHPEWPRELKSICDTFPALKLVVSGSSALQIHKASHDLSRRAILYHMVGLSFREYLELKFDMELPGFELPSVWTEHPAMAGKIVQQFEARGARLLAGFKDYLREGYYPYFLEYRDPALYALTLEQNMHTTIESDLLAVHPTLTGASIERIKRLLAVIAESAPFTPDLNRLAALLDITDQRTLKTYLKYLEDAGAIMTLSKGKRNLRALEKPDRIYLHDTNQMYALARRETTHNLGSIRETFFSSMLRKDHDVRMAERGDFVIDGEATVEIGGKSKTASQIRTERNAYVVVDDVEIGAGRRIPLWLFGFLY